MLYVLDPSGNTSHFIWKNDEEVTMWTRPAGQKDGFYTLKDRTREIQAGGSQTNAREWSQYVLGGTL